MAAPTQARANEYFNCDPVRGLLLFKRRPESEFSVSHYAKHLKRVGEPAGGLSKSSGYVKIHMDGSYYPAHKIIWLICKGEWVEYPAFEIDHINGDRSDNRLVNLRKVTKSGNQRNAGARVNNTSGVHGVNWKAGSDRWVARIWNGPNHVYLGQFKTLHEAKIARKAAERALGFSDVEKRAQMGRYLRPVR